jgi:ATP-binding cassette subfamily A (ABC1) protein 3
MITISYVIVVIVLSSKEYMRMMGLPNGLHWTAWFFKFFTLLAVSCLIITVLLKVSYYYCT